MSKNSWSDFIWEESSHKASQGLEVYLFLIRKPKKSLSNFTKIIETVILRLDQGQICHVHIDRIELVDGLIVVGVRYLLECCQVVPLLLG